MEHNYVVLPSNSSMSLYPDNTIANYKVQLARPLQFEQSFEVAITEIIYPFDPVTIHDNMEYVRFLQHELVALKLRTSDDKATFKYDTELGTSYLKAGTYRSSTQLLSALKNIFLEHKMKITFKKSENRFAISGFQKARVLKIEVSPLLARMLGYFSNADHDTTIDFNGDAPYTPDLQGGVHSMFIYSSIVENQLIGDKFAPLLRVVCPDGRSLGNPQVSEKYIKPYYLKVSKNYIDTIDIAIQTETGAAYPFRSGLPLIIKLHFQPQL